MLSVIKTFFKFLILIIILTVITFADAGGTSESREIDTPRGVIQVHKLNVRKKPSLKSMILGVLKKESIVVVHEVLEDNGGWLKISTDTLDGYVRNSSRYIKLVSIQEAKALTIKKELAQKKREIDLAKKKENEVLDALNDIDQALNSSRAMVASLKQEIDFLQKELAAISQEKKTLAVVIESDAHYAALRMAALYKLKMIGRMALFAEPDSVFSFFHQQAMLERILVSDFEVLKTRRNVLEDFHRLSLELDKKSRRKQDRDQQMQQQISTMEEELQTKNLILDTIREKKELAIAAVGSLEEAARKLDEQMKTLNKVADYTPENVSFKDLKERLELPVNGSIINGFGPARNGEDNTFTFQSGIDIKVDRGEPVKSVYKGRILFAQWLRGYGNLIIINHGDNYYTLYAHLEEFFKTKGDWVDTREVIATAGDTGSLKGPVLHFEVRHHDKPVDPLNWLKNGG